MAKTAAPVKKAPVKKAMATKKPAPKAKIAKGDGLVCEVCGLSVVVDDLGNSAGSIVFCCEEPMKKKAAKAKAKPAKK